MFRPRKSIFGICYPGYRYCGPGCSGPGPQQILSISVACSMIFAIPYMDLPGIAMIYSSNV